MKYIKSITVVRLSLFATALGVVFSVLASPLALADQVNGQSYFENATIGISNLIRRNHLGYNSILGSVMPNRDMSTIITKTAAGVDTGAGAVGTRALGIYGSGADNRSRKQALYCFLQNKYGLSVSDRHSTCTGSWPATIDWEKMGATLIVHQMLGKEWNEGTRVVTGTEWDTLFNRLVANNAIIMERSDHSHDDNTAGVLIDGVYDAVKWEYFDGELKDAWVFTQGPGGAPVYALEIICANPLGSMSGLPPYNPPVTQYSLVPNIDADRPDDAVVPRGESITIQNSVENLGPNQSEATTWRITRLEYGAGVNPGRTGGNSSNNPVDAFPGSSSSSQERNLTDQIFNVGIRNGDPHTYTVPGDAAYGSRVCFVVSVNRPTHSPTPEWRHSDLRCIIVASPSYSLVPTINLDRDNGAIVEPGEPTIVTKTVRNEGGDRSESAIWRVTRMVYGSGKVWNPGDKSGRSDDNEPCNSFPTEGRLAGEQQCRTVDGGERTDTFDPGQVLSSNVSSAIHDDAGIGQEICFVVSVSRPTFAASPSWRHSDLWCLKVGKKPKIQVWGGDVRSGGKINTSISTITSVAKTFGSWGEYGALSKKDNSGFSSGSGLNSDTNNGSNLQSSWSKLTFANTGTATDCAFGCYDFAFSSEGLVSQFTKNRPSAAPILSGTVNLNALGDGTHFAGSVNLSGTTIEPGKTIILLATGTVTIDGNIVYDNDGSTDGGYTNVWDIPQVVIRAPTIHIRNSASQVDAWLLATAIDDNESGAIDEDDAPGVLNTCIDVPLGTGLTADDCTSRLVINGPVVADIVHLRRTAGSGGRADQRGEPAEIFNLRADAYLWASTQGAGFSRVQTVSTKELSPRF